MYPSILGNPTDKDLERYPAVHLTGPHEWDPSVLDYTHPSGDVEPPWSNDPDERFACDPDFDEFGDYPQRAIQTLSIPDDSSSTSTPCCTQLCTLQDPMNVILLSWTIPTHLVMRSLLGPMTLMRDLPLILTLMSLGITPKGQYKLSVFRMTLHPP